MISQSCRKRFTLIELLVVIAIIAVLAAMLLPALDSARKHAMMVRDISNFRQLGIGVMSYASDHNSFYPLREGVAENQYRKVNSVKVGGLDDRQRLNEYIPVNEILVSPFAPQKLDMMSSDAQRVYVSYPLFFGFRLDPAEPIMARVGDAIRFSGKEWSLLAVGQDFMTPDRSEVMYPVPGATEYVVDDDFRTDARLNVPGRRTPIPVPALHDHGAVIVHSNIRHDEPSWETVPYNNTLYQWPDYRMHLPPPR